jgi:hypothetical protein
MDWTLIIAVLEALALLTGGIWAVSRIEGTTRELRVTLDGVKDTVSKLDGHLDGVIKQGNDHEARLQVVEAKLHRRPR